MANHGEILWVNMVHPGKLGCNSYNLALKIKGFRAQKGFLLVVQLVNSHGSAHPKFR